MKKQKKKMPNAVKNQDSHTNKNGSNGITLVALVVSIVVMLVLARCKH